MADASASPDFNASTSPRATPAPQTVVLVGHCTPDSGMLRSAVGRIAPNAQFVSVQREAALAEHLRGDRLWLVNRALDGDFSAEVGQALIARAAQAADPPVLMLVSNIAEAQQEAVALGAMPGFGKSALYTPETAATIRAALDRAASKV
jgi:two-component system, chemotaxis family, chemotaxis protein CheY